MAAPPAIAPIAGRRAVLCGASGDVSYAEGATYDSISFGGAARTVEKNSVLLIPDLLTQQECAQLIEDVERHHAAAHDEAKRPARQEANEPVSVASILERYGSTGSEWSGSAFGDEPVPGFHRYRIPMLSGASATLFEEVLRERLLPFVERELPELVEYFWARSDAVCSGPASSFQPPERPADGTPLGSLAYKFSPQEPAINRYTEGGRFPTHTDQQALTLNILLRRPEETFEGGGTAFWREQEEQVGAAPATASGAPDAGAGAGAAVGSPAGGSGDAPAAFTLQPDAGVGVIFNGTVTHAGQPVTKGVRHVLVASFSITNPE